MVIFYYKKTSKPIIIKTFSMFKMSCNNKKYLSYLKEHWKPNLAKSFKILKVSFNRMKIKSGKDGFIYKPKY
jgi:hypothetical protein